MDRLGFFVKFAMIIGIIALVTIFFVDVGSEAFYLTLTAIAICLIIIIVGSIMIRKRKE